MVDAALLLNRDSWQSHKALRIATEIMDTFKPGDQESVIKCRKIARDFLGINIDNAKVYDSGAEVMAYGIGHCHIGKLAR